LTMNLIWQIKSYLLLGFHDQIWFELSNNYLPAHTNWLIHQRQDSLRL